ncbi:MAG: hypothetical protein O7G87_10275 [bacterium]|nr:hypothetical protein [bacterium]
MNLRLFNLLLILLLATTTGCATYALHTHDFRTQLAGGHFEQALSSLKGVNKKTNRLLYHMENGLVEHYRGQFQASNKHFETAERLSDRLFTRSLSKEIASFVTNDAVRSYRGETFELTFIHYYRALNYWYLGLPEDALVECRKANLKLEKIASINGETSYKNDAFIHYLTGLFYEATGEWNDAYISYQDAARAYENYADFNFQPPPSLDRDLARVEDILDGTPGVEIRFASTGLHRPTGDGELVLFSEIGFVPRKIQKDIDLPIYDHDIKRGKRVDIAIIANEISGRYHTPYRTHHVEYWLRAAIPAYESTHPQTHTIRVLAAGQRAESVPAEDLASIARVTFEHQMPKILTRTVARGFVKYLAYRQADKKNKVLGFFTQLFTLSTEVADTRSWVSLPNSIQIVRLHLPPGVHDLILQALDANGNIIETHSLQGVEILPGERTFLNHRMYR